MTFEYRGEIEIDETGGSLQSMPHLLWPRSLFLEQYCEDIKSKVDQAGIAATHLYFSAFDIFFSPSGKSYKAG